MRAGFQANAKDATVLGSIPASFDTVESEGQQIKQCWMNFFKNPKSPPLGFQNRNCTFGDQPKKRNLGSNDAGDKLPPVSTTPAANFPPV
jgi:hypothetical protein